MLLPSAVVELLWSSEDDDELLMRRDEAMEDDEDEINCPRCCCSSSLSSCGFLTRFVGLMMSSLRSPLLAAADLLERAAAGDEDAAMLYDVMESVLREKKMPKK